MEYILSNYDHREEILFFFFLILFYTLVEDKQSSKPNERKEKGVG